jgi:hypothetical protein
MMKKDEFNRIFDNNDEIDRLKVFDKTKVGVIGIGSSVGVSLISECLAKQGSKNGFFPCVIELGGGSIYDGIGIDKRFDTREYFQFFNSLSREESIRNKKNVSDGVNWISKAPEENHIRLSNNHIMKLVNNAVGEFIICDFSRISLEEDNYLLIQELLLDMDKIIVVIDPLPSKLLRGAEQLERIREIFSKPIYVINKYNQGINKNELMKFLKIHRPIYIPLIPLEYIYEAEYTCNLPYNLDKVKKDLKQPLEEILSRIF